jgi:hypothetical protein
MAVFGGLMFGAAAQAATISVEQVSCLPREDNGVLRAQVSEDAAGQPGRLYFRWKDHKAFYWVPMEIEAGGRYWATPPKPEKRNEVVEYYAVLVDATGNTVARSEARTAQVTDDCPVRLNAKERGVAENLTIGETAPDQRGKEVFAFLCDGIVTRVDPQGIRRADEVCRACVVAWWNKRSVLLPTAAVVGIIVTDDDPEPSPSRPR